MASNGNDSSKNEEELLVNWSFELYKKSIATTIETLKLLITLSSTLLSAYLVFYEQLNIDSTFIRSIPVLGLLLSLFCSLVGVFPRQVDVDTNNIETLADARDEDLSFKKNWLLASMVFLFATFIWAAVVIICTESG